MGRPANAASLRDWACYERRGPHCVRFYGTSKGTGMPHLIDSNIGIVFMESIRDYVQYRPGNNKYTKREEAAKRNSMPAIYANLIYILPGAH